MNKKGLFILTILTAWLAYKNYSNKRVIDNSLSDKDIDTVIDKNLRRGERINNPMNIEKSANKWQGLAPDQSKDVRFAAFVQPEYGVRAFVKIIRTYMNNYKLNTLRKILNRYAPSVENDTNAYVNHVAKLTGITPDEVIVLNEASAFKLAKAFITHEQGRNIYSDNMIIKGVRLGLA